MPEINPYVQGAPWIEREMYAVYVGCQALMAAVL